MQATNLSSFHFLYYLVIVLDIFYCRTRLTPWPIHFCNLNFLEPLCWNLIGCPCELIRMIHWYSALLAQMVVFALLILTCKCHKLLKGVKSDQLLPLVLLSKYDRMLLLWLRALDYVGCRKMFFFFFDSNVKKILAIMKTFILMLKFS